MKSLSDAQTTSLAFDAPEVRFTMCLTLSPDNLETHFSYLDPPAHCFSHFPETRTTAGDGNKDPPVNPKLHLQNQFPLNQYNPERPCNSYVGIMLRVKLRWKKK